MDQLKLAQELGEVTIAYALERWLASVKADRESGNEYQTAAKHIGAWGRSNNLIRLSQITPDALDHWKSSGSPKAKNHNDRIGKTTAGRRLEKVKMFLRYCVKMRWLAASPAAELKAIKPDPSVTWPLVVLRPMSMINRPVEPPTSSERRCAQSSSSCAGQGCASVTP